jgi:hypothetical protein
VVVVVVVVVVVFEGLRCQTFAALIYFHILSLDIQNTEWSKFLTNSKHDKNTLLMGYTNQSVNVVQWNNGCLFWDPHKTNKYTVWAERGAQNSRCAANCCQAPHISLSAVAAVLQVFARSVAGRSPHGLEGGRVMFRPDASTVGGSCQPHAPHRCHKLHVLFKYTHTRMFSCAPLALFSCQTFQELC